MKDIAVIYKHSAIESYSAKQIRRHRELNPELTRRMQSAHDDHDRSFARLESVIRDLELSAVFHERDHLSENLDKFRLVISFGGDGTFINASHFIMKTLLLGVNSSTKSSVGHYCRFELETQAGTKKLQVALCDIFENKAKEAKLLRIRVSSPGMAHVVGFPVLNDVLFSEENPAATARYSLEYQNKLSFQKSSGLWISTPTGSSAAFKSAGGQPFKQRELRFVVRELYSAEGARLTRGRIAQGEKLAIVSSMMRGALYLDGAHHKVPVALGEHMTIDAHPQYLRAIY